MSGIFGRAKTTETQQQTQQVTPQRTAEQAELDKLTLEQIQAAQPQTLQLQESALNLGNLLATGQSLPGQFRGVLQGIDDQVTGDIVNRSLDDLNAQLQASGVGTFRESGVAQDLGTDLAGQIRTDVAQFNLQNLNNLLNLAFGGQAQVQQPISQQTGLLGQRLAAVTPVNATGSSTGTQTIPFSQTALAGGIGQGVGSGFGQQFGSFIGKGLFGGCWVAAEIFGGWHHPKTEKARYYIANQAPTWFREAYIKHGKWVADFIKDKPALKSILRPIFEHFANKSNLEEVHCG